VSMDVTNTMFCRTFEHTCMVALRPSAIAPFDLSPPYFLYPRPPTLV